MKKLAIYVSIFLFLLSLTACTTHVPKTAENALPSKSTYTEEFPYLPAYTNMELQSITQPDENRRVTAKYLIKNTTAEKVLTEYADILKKDGWTENWSYTKDNKPYSMVAQKDNHTTSLLPRQTDNNVLLIIGSN